MGLGLGLELGLGFALGTEAAAKPTADGGGGHARRVGTRQHGAGRQHGARPGRPGTVCGCEDEGLGLCARRELDSRRLVWGRDRDRVRVGLRVGVRVGVRVRVRDRVRVGVRGSGWGSG